MPRTKQSAPERPSCLCGCGETPKSRRAAFLPGHDKRFHDAIGAGEVGKRQLKAVAKLVNVLKPVKVVKNTSKKPRPCDVSCRYAHSNVCNCSCGGDGHFAGWLEILDVPA